MNRKEFEDLLRRILAIEQRLRAIGAGIVSAAITALTGDVTATGPGSAVTTITNNVVTDTKLADMPEARIKGRAVGAGTGDPQNLTGTQATVILDVMVGDTGTGGTKGLVPAPGAGDAAANKFLKADGTFAVPSGTGAPTDADYLVKTANAGLSAERVVTDNTDITADWSVAGVVKFLLGAFTGDITKSAGSLATTIANNTVTPAKMDDGAALSVLGRSANSSGDRADIVAANDGEVVRRSGTSVGFGAVNLASANAVTGILPLANVGARTASAAFNFNNGTADLATGDEVQWSTPAACTLVRWRIEAKETGNIVFDIWSDDFASYRPTVADTIIGGGGTKPTLSSDNAAEDTTLTGYTLSYAAGDSFVVHVDSCSGIKNATLSLWFTVP